MNAYQASYWEDQTVRPRARCATPDGKALSQNQVIPIVGTTLANQLRPRRTRAPLPVRGSSGRADSMPWNWPDQIAPATADAV